MKYNYKVTQVNGHVLKCVPLGSECVLYSFVDVVCCGVIYDPLHSFSGKFFFVFFLGGGGSLPLVYVDFYSIY